MELFFCVQRLFDLTNEVLTIGLFLEFYPNTNQQILHQPKQGRWASTLRLMKLAFF